ncbi:MAG: alpha-mannosidase [Bacteroidales bacterium]|nr:alpha-mannosidase [Bacteroidales bacterium]
MKITSSFFLIFILLFNSGVQAQKEIIINYYRPYQYEASENTVKAWIDPKDLGPDFTISLDGRAINYSIADSGRVTLILPLAGKDAELIFSPATGTANAVIIKQQFRPLVPADWGYFSKGTVNIICSSHQDIAWMNTPDSCREERIHEIIIPALDLIDKNPAYRFEMEQTLNLMEVLAEVPAEKQRIMDAFTKGQFTWGATFNQPYEGLESGEQLVRQTYLGRKWIKDNLPGMDALAAYNVDVPGRSLQSPQILAKAGIKYLFVSRMKEGFYNWYSPDGTKILTYSPGNYGWALLVYQYFEGDAITALQKLHKVMLNWNDYYASRNLPPQYAVIISTDAGGPKDYSKIIGEWNEIAKSSGFDIPLIQHATTEEFLGKIDVEGIKIDSISGERPDLWLYIHGPAHYEAIRAKKAAAVSLPAAEIFSSINGMVKGSQKGYPSANLNKGWYKSIYPDHGWGGNHGEITDSIFRASLEEGNSIGEKILGQSLKELASEVRLRNPNSILVYNDLSWNRSGIADIDISDKKGNDWFVADAAGKIVPSVVNVNGSKKTVSFKAENVPSLGYKTYFLRKGKASSDAEIKTGSNFYENSFYSIELGPGGIRSLYDKELKKEVFNTTKYAGGDLLNLGYNGNGAGEFIQIKPTNFENAENLGIKNGTWTLTRNSPLSATFESVAALKNFSVRQIITVYHHVKQIDFEYEIPDWPGEHNRQLRVAFPLNMNNSQITYDVPMGIVNAGKDELNRSPLGWSWEGTYRQMPAEINPREIENFVSASDKDLGFTMSTNLAVADWIDPGRESVDYPVLQGIVLSSHKSCHYLGNWYHQTGSHHFMFSVTSHKPGWKNGYQFGVEGNHPLYTLLMEKSQSGTLPEELSFISTSSPFVRITALKKSESANPLIMRMVEMAGVDEKVDLKFYFPLKALFKTNLIEEDAKATGLNGKVLKLDIGKNSVETFRIDLQ